MEASGSGARLRVAVTLEQCWHRVPGGTASSAIALVDALRRRGDLDMIGVAARHHEPPPDPWTPPVVVRQLPLPRPALYEAWLRLGRPRVEQATGPVDLVHATSIIVPPRSAPLVVSLHDVAFLRTPAHFTARGVRLFNRGFDLTRRHADRVLVPSAATMRDCIAHGINPDRLRLVPLGVEVHPASQDDIDGVIRRFSLERPYVLWVGTIEPRKNLAGLVEAFRSVPAPTELVLVGPEGWNEDLDRLLAGDDHFGRQLRDRVRVLGFVSEGDLRALYAGARVFCYPSLLEGFGLPVLEAMAQGTPVVTSSGTSTEELADDAALAVEPTDPEAVANAINLILGDDDEAERLGKAGRARAAGFTWERTAELTAAAYREVAR